MGGVRFLDSIITWGTRPGIDTISTAVSDTCVCSCVRVFYKRVTNVYCSIIQAKDVRDYTSYRTAITVHLYKRVRAFLK